MNENTENMEIMTEETEETTDMVVVEDGVVDDVDTELSVGQKAAVVAGVGIVGYGIYKAVLKPVGKKFKAWGEKTIVKLADKIKSKDQETEADLDENVESEDEAK